MYFSKNFPCVHIFHKCQCPLHSYVPCFFSFSVYFKLFTCQNMKTSLSFLYLLHSIYIAPQKHPNWLFPGFCYSGYGAMPNLAGRLFIHLSETWVWGFGTGIYHWLLCHPISPVSHFPTVIVPDSLLGCFCILWPSQFLSGPSMPRGIKLLLKVSFYGQRIR